MKKHRLKYSAEAISVQNTEFFDELVTIFSALLEKGKEGKVVIQDHDLLVPVIKKYTNMTVEPIGSDDRNYNAYTQIPDIDANSPLAQGLYRLFRVSEDGLRKIAKTKEVVAGWVDLEAGRLGGYFAELKFPLCIGMGWFNARQVASAEELAAICAHELGHVMGDMEYLAEAIGMNVTMGALAQDWLMADRTKRVKLIDAASDAIRLELEPKIRDSLVSMEEPDNVMVVMLSPDAFTVRSAFGPRELLMTGSETSADQYAARIGAGPYVATAMMKFYKYTDPFTAKTKLGGLLADIWIAARLAAAGVTVISAPPLSLVLFITCITSAIMNSATDLNDVYETPRNRLRKLVVESRNYLKQTNLPKEYVKKCLTALEEIEASVETYAKDNRLLEGLINTVWRSRGRAVGQRQRQELIENLGSNVLFQTAAQLRTK